jgi:hypothetical protein
MPDDRRCRQLVLLNESSHVVGHGNIVVKACVGRFAMIPQVLLKVSLAEVYQNQPAVLPERRWVFSDLVLELCTE